MTAMGPVIRSQLQHSPKEYAALVETHQPQLLELRTEAGAVYLRPSRWERIRLQWAFRHFHVLCPELLSRHDRRLIERLSRSAAVKPEWPVSRDSVFGVIEKALPISTKTARCICAVETRPERARRVRWGDAGLSPSSPWWQKAGEILAPILAPIKRRPAWGRHPSGLEEWKGLAMLGVVCAAIIILARVYDLPAHPGAMRGHAPTISAAPAPMSNSSKTELASPPAIGKAAVAARPAAVSPVISKKTPSAPALLAATRSSVPTGSSAEGAPAIGLAVPATEAALETETPVQSPPVELSAASTNPASTPGELAQGIAVPNPASVTAAPERPHISELPQGSFPYPVVSDPNFVGKVILRAVIGTDGLVKDVTVLSGNPKVAQAVASAVRQWRYAPDEAGGHAIEAETEVGVSFFGQDAISVTSAP